MDRVRIFYLICSLPILASCSASKQTEETKQNEQDNIYVFNNPVVPDSTFQQSNTNSKQLDALKHTYYVQVGAFSTKERAEKFIQENKNRINMEMKVTFNSAVQLFVVRLSPFFSREEAESFRNKIRNIDSFKDAFIVTEGDK
ncbi:SPOR domain-containing protein [Melioribacteraceae bacterium 4301-Me]|uniref:SPOR domain-containing protein n=1 Tax=Pyranulibacter aquaticus TaxID=3163344 RepID=UPI0035978D51